MSAGLYLLQPELRQVETLEVRQQRLKRMRHLWKQGRPVIMIMSS